MTEFIVNLRRLPYPSLVVEPARLAKRFLLVLLGWHRNYRTRKHLDSLPTHLLDDIGIDSQTANKEVRKPFWK
jgi:uncharacterized protein YjiS (DUF1127 family)